MYFLKVTFKCLLHYVDSFCLLSPQDKERCKNKTRSYKFHNKVALPRVACHTLPEMIKCQTFILNVAAATEKLPSEGFPPRIITL